MTDGRRDEALRLHCPDIGGIVMAAGYQLLVVRTKGCMGHPNGMSNRLTYRLLIIGVPNARLIVPASGHHESAVVAEPNAIDLLFVGAELKDRRSVYCVPTADRPV